MKVAVALNSTKFCSWWGSRKVHCMHFMVAMLLTFEMVIGYCSVHLWFMGCQIMLIGWAS